MSKFLKLAGAAALALGLPVGASAAVVQMSINNATPYILDDSTVLYRWDTVNEFADNDTSGQDYFFKFSASNLPQGTSSQITVNRTGDFSDLKIAWSADTTMDGGDTYIPITQVGGLGVADFFFSMPASPYYLLTSYTSRSNGGNLDYAISAVPLPAAGGLLLLALGGLGVARKRKAA